MVRVLSLSSHQVFAWPGSFSTTVRMSKKTSHVFHTDAFCFSSSGMVGSNWFTRAGVKSISIRLCSIK